MRLPFLRARPRVEMMSPDDTVEWMRTHSRELVAEVGEQTARGLLDAFLRNQKRPRQERREWLAYLFDGAPSSPMPFAMTGEDASGKITTDHRLRELVELNDWAGVEKHMLNQGWPREAAAEAIRRLTQGPPMEPDRAAE